MLKDSDVKFEKKLLVRGIGDPNFILVRKDKKFLVSDDATNEIFLADTDGNLELYCTSVNHPNGLALSKDENMLYVAQIFTGIRPVVADNSVWAVPLQNGVPTGSIHRAVQVGVAAAPDGLAMDKLGRIYIAANREGKIWRYDPVTDKLLVVAEGIYGAASIVFGEGKFDHKSIYVTTTNAKNRGGKIYKINVGVEGMPVNR